ncbi:MAG: SpoIIE family protein phosphatase [Janthinobacterium lividum]
MTSLRWLVHSEAGDGHTNEDVVEVRPHPSDVNLILCALADGQGGQVGGAKAAQVAVEESLRTSSLFPALELSKADPWYAILGAADEAVSEHDAAGYCTLISLCISSRKVQGASCGDSGVLLLNGGQDFLLTENQRKNPPVGSSAAHPVAFEANLQPGWSLLALSDGVWKFVGWECIIQLAADNKAQKLVTALRQAALDAGGGRMQDDFSLALFFDE